MNCIIVDDNPMARLFLKEMIARFDSLNLIAECEDPIKAINIIKKEQVDLILLDIEMPNMTGLEFLKSLDKHPLVILITAKPDYALEAFEYNIVDYLVTPFKDERFVRAINKAQELFESSAKTFEQSNHDYIFVRDKGVLTKITTDNILYIQALGDYVTIFTKDKKYTVRLSLSSAYEKLSHQKFMRVHRSYIIAIDKVDFIEENMVSINQSNIPLSDLYRAELIKRINLF